MTDLGDYSRQEAVAVANQDACPTCTASMSGYCPMWNMGMSEPECPLYSRRQEVDDD